MCQIWHVRIQRVKNMCNFNVEVLKVFMYKLGIFNLIYI